MVTSGHSARRWRGQLAHRRSLGARERYSVKAIERTDLSAASHPMRRTPWGDYQDSSCIGREKDRTREGVGPRGRSARGGRSRGAFSTAPGRIRRPRGTSSTATGRFNGVVSSGPARWRGFGKAILSGSTTEERPGRWGASPPNPPEQRPEGQRTEVQMGATRRKPTLRPKLPGPFL